MCGIAGIVPLDSQEVPSSDDLRRMLRIQSYRGPDDEGIEVGPGWGFGHRRLSIVDLSRAGHQPMREAATGVTLTYNGEIFNYVELRDELRAKGHHFHSTSDTEVILAAYLAWGTDCVTRFNGMWAFALWDPRDRSLFASRDRFGIKPFMWTKSGGRLLFASEAKALLAVDPALASPNLVRTKDFLTSGNIVTDDSSFFESISRLPPAHNLAVADGKLRTWRFWDYPAAEPLADPDAPERLRELLSDSVRLRLRSDVPVGLSLSGGLDSTSIAVLARRHDLSARLHSFSCVFREPSLSVYDESFWVNRAVEACGAEPSYVTPSSDRFVQDLETLTWHLDSPATSGSVIALWHVMRLAGTSVKVVLDGQGADELLAGYGPFYCPPALVDSATRVLHEPAAVVDLAADARAFLQTKAVLGEGRGVRLSWLMRYLLPASQRFYHRFAGIRDAFAPEFRDPPAAAVVPRRYRDHLNDELWRDHSQRILPSLLHYNDALGMAHSLESRLPFLDHRLVEYSFRIPGSQKMRHLVTKSLLRESMIGILPEDLRTRTSKLGFVTPDARWFRHELAPKVREILLDRRTLARGIFDRQGVERALAAHESGRRNLAFHIFRWLSLEFFFRQFIEGQSK